MERIDKLLSATGRWSRKEVKELVRQGRVLDGGRVVLRPEEKGDPAALCLTVDGVPVDCSPFVYVMLNKPDGVLSATEDGQQPTVLDLLPPELRQRGLFPVGRLDKDTTGLLLLTDDGDLAHRLLSPRKHVDKVYLARVDGVVVSEDIEPGHPAGGEIPPGETDAGRPRQAGACAAPPVDGAFDAGRGTKTRKMAVFDPPGADGTAKVRLCYLNL